MNKIILQMYQICRKCILVIVVKGFFTIQGFTKRSEGVGHDRHL